MNRKYILLLFIALQIAIVVGMVVQSLIPLYTGTPVLMAVRAYDPRDIFRGNYVALSYDFNLLNLDSLRNDIDSTRTYHFGDEVYVGLAKKGKYFTPVSVFNQLPQTYGGDTTYVLGIVQHEVYGNSMGIRCGVESYFAPPATAKAIERRLQNFAVNDSLPPDTVAVTIMVAPSGKARIKQLHWKQISF